MLWGVWRPMLLAIPTNVVGGMATIVEGEVATNIVGVMATNDVVECGN